MKSFVAAATLLALATSSLAAPSSSNLQYGKRQSCTEPSQQQVVDAINSWNIDVQQVNAFLDTTPDLSTTYQNSASLVLQFATDEPFELGTLACISGQSDAATAAVADLMAVFGGVPTAIQAIQADITAGNLDDISTQVQTIGQIRCCHVLPDLDSLWQDSADNEGVSNLVNTVVPRPNQCSSITC